MSNNNITERDLGYAPIEGYNYVNTIPKGELKMYQDRIMKNYYNQNDEEKKEKEKSEPSSVGGKKQRKTRKYRKHNKKSIKSNSKKIKFKP